jgi:Raf kinase inhibitor-like YbhB/YbcL family protein
MKTLIVSIDFDKEVFPKKHTCDGENVSPEIRIGRIESPYLAVILEDRIGMELVCQWIIWNIKAREIIPQDIPKEQLISDPFEAVQGTNDFHTVGYYGPCPKVGEAHTYFFNVYGLDRKLDLKPGSDARALRKAMVNHTIQYGGQAIATYQR